MTRAAGVATLVAVATTMLTGCGPTTTAATTTTTTTPTAKTTGGAAATAAPTPTTPAGAPTSVAAPGPGGVLDAEDPDHGTAQTFPAPGTCHARTVAGGVLPDPVCTPGATDPHVTQATVGTTICRAGGYTSTVRPPQSVTSVEKRSAMASYHETNPTSSYEFDHLVPLELGGSPNSPHNLWPEPGTIPNPKDKLEGALHDLVCSHRMTLIDAQNAIAGDWITTYRQVLGATPPG